MPGLLIKNLPAELHRKLKEEAARQHRSMAKHVLAILEEALSTRPKGAAQVLPEPLKPAKPISPERVVEAIRQAREAPKAKQARPKKAG